MNRATYLCAGILIIAPTAEAKPADQTVVLDDIPPLTETSMGGEVLPSKPYHAQIVVPAEAVVSMTDESSKYERDARAYPHLATHAWEIDVQHSDGKSLEAETKSYARFGVLRHEATADGYVLVLGSKTAPRDVIVSKKAIALQCHAVLLDHSEAARDAALAVCQTLAAVNQAR